MVDEFGNTSLVLNADIERVRKPASLDAMPIRFYTVMAFVTFGDGISRNEFGSKALTCF